MLALQTALETSTCAGMDELDKIVIGHVEWLFEFDAAVGEGAECPLLVELGGGRSVTSASAQLAIGHPVVVCGIGGN